MTYYITITYYVTITYIITDYTRIKVYGCAMCSSKTELITIKILDGEFILQVMKNVLRHRIHYGVYVIQKFC